MQQLLDSNDLLLMEAAIVERLRRSPGVALHPQLVHAPLIYDAAGRRALTDLYQGYIDVATRAGKPFLMCTPTWRANQNRVAASDITAPINQDGAEMLQADAVSDWGDEMLRLHRACGVKILGGCCGTGSEHLRYLVTR